MFKKNIILLTTILLANTAPLRIIADTIDSEAVHNSSKKTNEKVADKSKNNFNEQAILNAKVVQEGQQANIPFNKTQSSNPFIPKSEPNDVTTRNNLINKSNNDVVNENISENGTVENFSQDIDVAPHNKLESMWGTSKVYFDDTTGVLEIHEGTIGTWTPDYVDTNRLIKKEQVKKIVLIGKVFTPSNSQLLFSNWIELEEIEGELDTSQTNNMYAMFYLSKKLTKIDVKNWLTSSVTNINSIFWQSGIVALDVSEWDTSKVTDMSNAFHDTKNLSSLNLSKWDTSNVTDMALMFARSGVEHLDVGNFNTSKVTNMYSMFAETKSLLTVGDLVNWNTSNVTDISFMFSQSGVNSLNVSNWDTSKVATMAHTFNGTGNLTNLNVSNWDTSNVTNMYLMFSYSGLTELDVSNFKTSKVTNMSGMFTMSQSLKKIGDLGSWDTSEVTNMSNQFSFTGINSLNISHFNTSKVTNMSQMFAVSQSLLEIGNMDGWDTSNVNDMSGMFAYTELTSLNLKNFNTSNVTNMSQMFTAMPKLEILNISNFNTEKVTSAEYIFANDFALSEITIGNKCNFSQYFTGLPLIPTESGEFTGRWIKTDPQFPESIYGTSELFMTNYNGGLPGTYVWERPQILIHSGKVICRYQTTEGKSIADDLVVEGSIGEQYTTEQKVIKGYTFKEVLGNVTGKFTDQPQTVTYVYTKNIVAPASGQGNKENSSYENKSTLPQTGESESISIVGMISGTLFILGAMTLFRFKRKINK